MTQDTFVTPGMRICALEENNISGQGTYSKSGYIYSSLAGILKLVPSDNPGSSSSEIISVQVRSPSEVTQVPNPGDLVTAKIISVNPRFSKARIICINDNPLRDFFRSQIRREDVKATEKDKVEMYKSYRPGDIVLARVISLGEPSSGYLLSTAENELGVVIAYSSKCENAVKMLPVSWTEMQCPVTFIKEYRKIAKVVPEDLLTTDDKEK